MNEVYKDNKNGIYWGKIPLTSSDGIQKTVVIWGAYEEYLEDTGSTPEGLSQKIENEWKEKSIKDDNFFNTNVYYSPRLYNSEKGNLLKFLRTIKA